MHPTQIAGPVFLTDAPLTQYFAPAGGATIDLIQVQNVSATVVTFSISIGTDSAPNRFISSQKLNPGQILSIRGPFTLDTDEIIQAFASTNDSIVFTAEGVAASITFPLTVDSSGRFMRTATGDPFLSWGDAGWEGPMEITADDLEVYLSARRSQGFNTILIQVTNSVKYNASSVAPAARGAGLVFPWSKNTSGGTWTGIFANHDADWSTPVEQYWNWIGYFLYRAQVYGFWVIADWAYYGFALGVSDGWYTTIGNSANTRSVSQTFGQYCANKCSQYNIKNVIWSFGTDTFPTPGSEEEARILRMHDGWLAGGGTADALGHYERSSGSHNNAAFSSRITVRGTYPGVGNGSSFATDVARLRLEYAASPTQPVICVEANYTPFRTNAEMRCLQYHGWLSSIGGYSGYGNDNVAAFIPGWETELNDTGAEDMARMFTFAADHTNAHELVPRGLGSIGTLVTTGGGTLQTMGNSNPTDNSDVATDNTNGADWVAAAATPDGSLLLAYVPDAHTGSFDVQMTALRGTVTARWFDPTDGSYSSIGSFPNTGTHTFITTGTNSAGANDWLLELTA